MNIEIVINESITQILMPEIIYMYRPNPIFIHIHVYT